MSYEDSGYSTRKVLAIAVPTALTIMVSALVIALAAFNTSIANTKANKELGTICVEAGGSWVQTYSGYQCIAGK